MVVLMKIHASPRSTCVFVLLCNGKVAQAMLWGPRRGLFPPSVTTSTRDSHLGGHAASRAPVPLAK